MKARYRYRIYPTPGQQTALAKLFGCVRVVWNDALAFCINQYQTGQKRPKNAELQKQFITQAKRTIERQWLSDVSCVPLQQSLNDLEQAYQNFFKSCKGQRKGRPVKPPRLCFRGQPFNLMNPGNGIETCDRTFPLLLAFTIIFC